MSDLLADLQAALGDAYAVERELGGGGMSRVFVAVERGLGRRVVVKVLPPELAAGVSADRFRRETQLAASLQHPHIVPLLAAGAADELLYYTMPLVEGESLRAKLEREGPLPVAEAVRFLREVVDALAYAHRRGVVHRDIKPDNVLLAEQHAQVTDFGVAKALSAAAGAASLTSAGIALGTPAYMAPEQALADPAADHRVDLYAVGILGYEMLAGRPPFTPLSPQEVIAAHVTETPRPVTTHRPEVPAALNYLVMRCLEKKPSDRWQTADELLVSLEAFATPSQGTAPLPAPRPRPGIRLRAALWAAAVVAVALGVWAVRRVAGPGATPPSASRLAVMPFSVRGVSDVAYLGDGIVNLLGTSLDGAGDLRSVDPRAVLGAVARSGGTALDPEAARRIAGRLEAGLFVLGDIVDVGGRLRIEASLYDAARGSDPAAQATVEGPAAQVFGLVDTLAERLLAARSGGPGSRVTRIAAVTTASLPALKDYLDGERLLRGGQYAAALEAFQKAVAQDSTFALAYYRLSVAAEWATRTDVARAASEEAVRHSSRLATHDRMLLDALLASREGDGEEAERRYRAIVGLYPDDVEAWFQLGEALFHYAPRFARSVVESGSAWERVLALEPDHVSTLYHLARVAAYQGRRAALDSLTQRLRGLTPEGDRGLEMEALRAVTLGDRAAVDRAARDLAGASDVTLPIVVWSAAVFGRAPAAAEVLQRVMTDPVRTPYVQAMGHVGLAHLEAAQGRWRAAGLELSVAQQLNPTVGLEYGGLFAALPFLPVARAEIEARRAALSRWNAASVPPTANPSAFYTVHDSLHRQLRAYLLGLLSARLGDEAASRYLAELERLPSPAGTGSLVGDLALSLKAQVAVDRGRAAEALTALESERMRNWYQLLFASPFYSGTFDRYARASLLAGAGRLEEALAWYGSFDDIALYDLPFVAPGRLERARILERLGRRADAAAEYGRFVDLWKNCDPELRPLVDSARAAVGRLRLAAR